jgi:hypothetical protein
MVGDDRIAEEDEVQIDLVSTQMNELSLNSDEQYIPPEPVLLRGKQNQNATALLIPDLLPISRQSCQDIIMLASFPNEPARASNANYNHSLV